MMSTAKEDEDEEDDEDNDEEMILMDVVTKLVENKFSSKRC